MEPSRKFDLWLSIFLLALSVLFLVLVVFIKFFKN